MSDRRVIDVHGHFSIERREWFGAYRDAHPELEAVVNLWDIAPTSGRTARAALAPWGSTPDGMILFHHPDLSALGSPGRDEAGSSDLQDAWNLGARGIKIWKDLGLWLRDTASERVAVDDPRLDWLWSGAAQANAPIAIHIGDAPAFFQPIDQNNERIVELGMHPEYWFGDRERFPPLEQVHDEFESLVAKHPLTTFIAVHFGCFLPYDRLHRMLGTYPNLYVDTSASLSDLGRPTNRTEVLRIFHAFPERILFGTDLIRLSGVDLLPPASDDDPYSIQYMERHYQFFETADEQDLLLPEQGDWRITGLGLPPSTVEALYQGNARKLLGIPQTIEHTPGAAHSTATSLS
jgi:hypothetical protein